MIEIVSYFKSDNVIEHCKRVERRYGGYLYTNFRSAERKDRGTTTAETKYTKLKLHFDPTTAAIVKTATWHSFEMDMMKIGSKLYAIADLPSHVTLDDNV
jgi:hypothetical protein